MSVWCSDKPDLQISLRDLVVGPSRQLRHRGPRRRDREVVAGPCDDPLTRVDRVMVVGAEQDHVLQSCGAAVVPGFDVVGFGPGCWNGAARKDAAMIAGDERFAQVCRRKASGAADVEYLTRGAKDDRDDVGIARESTDESDRNGPSMREVRRS